MIYKVDNYATAARNEIGERSFQHSQAIRDAQARKADTERQIAEERRKEGEMLASESRLCLYSVTSECAHLLTKYLALDDERHAIQEMNAALNHLRNNLSKVREQSQQLEAELNTLRKEVTTERAEKERQGKTLKDMKTRDQEDLDALQEAIGWRLEGIGRKSAMLPQVYHSVCPLTMQCRGQIVDAFHSYRSI
jgi:kinetochore protein Spc25